VIPWRIYGLCYFLVTESANDPCSQAQGLTLQKDVLANVSDFDQGIPYSSVSVLAGNAAVLSSDYKNDRCRGHPHLSQSGQCYIHSSVSVSDLAVDTWP
jgi:hypothetical protein